MEFICKCNNCNTLMFDENPTPTQPKINLEGKRLDLVRMGSVTIEGETIWVCPKCNVDDYLVDFTESTLYRKVGNIDLNKGCNMANGLFNLFNHEITDVSAWFSEDIKNEFLEVSDEEFTKKAMNYFLDSYHNHYVREIMDNLLFMGVWSRVEIGEFQPESNPIIDSIDGLTHLIESFDKDGVEVVIYKDDTPIGHSYKLAYYDLELSTLKEICVYADLHTTLNEDVNEEL